MKAEIISIGTELTSGQNLDTNAQWLSRRLGEIGIAVHWHTTLADDLEENVAALRVAAARAGLVLITGGLGPTQDDLTREAMARVAGVELVFHEPSFEQITAMFAKRNRDMPERNRVQAMFPAGSEPIPNPVGTAPGVWLKVGDCLLGAMPGVPSEMFVMYEQQIRPRLLALGGSASVRIERKLNCFGAGESAIEELLGDVTKRGRVPEVGITASDATISLRILAQGASMEEALAQIGPTEQIIRERLGKLIFGTDTEELHEAVIRLLAEKRLTLSTAEGVTGGFLAARLTHVPGASAWYLGGLVAYDNRLKIEMLGVPAELIQQEGAVSGAVAQAMAAGCRTRFRTDLAVSAVGIAGPGGAASDRPAGLVHVGLAWADGATSFSYSWSGTRREVRSRTAKMALNAVRLHLLRDRP
ncbi:MAG: competence/damage-inducible protein A [Gemmataceae bacterium]